MKRSLATFLLSNNIQLSHEDLRLVKRKYGHFEELEEEEWKRIIYKVKKDKK